MEVTGLKNITSFSSACILTASRPCSVCRAELELVLYVHALCTTKILAKYCTRLDAYYSQLLVFNVVTKQFSFVGGQNSKKFFAEFAF